MIFNVKVTFFNKMQQIQLANQVKKNPENRNRKNRTHDKTPEEILKVRVQMFLGCRGYLPMAKPP